MYDRMFGSKEQMDYWERRMRRDLILGFITLGIAILIVLSIFIKF